MTHPNEELLSRGFEAFSKGDMGAVAALFADDIVWHSPGRGPLSGDHRGKDQVLGMFAKQAELTGGTFRVELHALLANDEHGVALTSASGEREGKAWEGKSVLVFHVREGKATEVWLHPDDLYASDDFFS